MRHAVQACLLKFVQMVEIALQSGVVLEPQLRIEPEFAIEFQLVVQPGAAVGQAAE